MSIIKLKQGQDLQTILNTYEIVLIQFSADWCRPCKFISPIIKDRFEKMFEKNQSLKEKIAYVHIDINEHSSLASKYKINYIPSFEVVTKGADIRCNPIVSGSDNVVIEYCINNGIPLEQ